MSNNVPMWQKVHVLTFRSRLYMGPGALAHLDGVLEGLRGDGVERVLVVTSRNAYKVSGAWDNILKSLEKTGISFVHYDGVSANPTDGQADEAAQLGLEHKAQAVIGIGGGSPIDTAKTAAVLLRHPGRRAREIYYGEFEPEGALPIVAINTTHGTGTEVDRFAVTSMLDNRHKLGMGFEFTYPVAGFDDIDTMRTLPREQALYTTIDALSHAFESATTRITTPYSIMLAEEAFRMAGQYLERVLENPDDTEARFHLAYGSAMAGVGFDIGALHMIHALEHPLSAHKPEIAHGLGLGMLMPAVVRRTYQERPEVCHALLRHIVPGLRPTPADADRAGAGFEVWMRRMGLTQKLRDFGFDEPSLVELAGFTWNVPAHRSLMSLAPFRINPDVVREVYLESLNPFVD